MLTRRWPPITILDLIGDGVDGQCPSVGLVVKGRGPARCELAVGHNGMHRMDGHTWEG